MLEVDGRCYTQSVAIYKLVARHGGLYPSDDPEAAYIVDSVVAHCEDAFPLCYQVRARVGLGLGLGLRLGLGLVVDEQHVAVDQLRTDGRQLLTDRLLAQPLVRHDEGAPHVAVLDEALAVLDP